MNIFDKNIVLGTDKVMDLECKYIGGNDYDIRLYLLTSYAISNIIIIINFAINGVCKQIQRNYSSVLNSGIIKRERCTI
jgi:hypothetical protein